MPKPQGVGQRYLPGLDGLRAIAVLAVIAFHEQFGWAPGGLLGVAVFFTLSGYLITDLLLGEWVADGRVRLRDFWLRRARRLLPALFAMLIVVTAGVTIVDRSRLTSLRGPVAAAVTYVSNWYLIVKNQSYFARFAPPQPFDHLWSLAVEEQFYLLWPWLLLLGLLCLRKLRRTSVTWLIAPTLALAAASALVMVLVYQPGLDPTRVYEGTDTRACGLLVGAALAMAWPSRGRAETKPRVRVAVDGAGLAGLLVIGLMIARLGQYSPFAYRGGLVLLSFATAAVLAAAAIGDGLVGRVLGWGPLRWIGVRSYGIYLWHFPVIVLTSPANSGEDVLRAVPQIAATVILAALSWRFVEEPVRHGALGRLWERGRSSGWRTALGRPVALGASAGLVGLLVVACAGLAGTIPAPGASTSGRVSGGALPGGSAVPLAERLPQGPRPPGLDPREAPATEPAPRTSCHAVVHIGDSTSDGLISPDYLPDAAQRIPAQYHDVGVSRVIPEISGARSIVEVLPGQVNGYHVARALYAGGYRGCWVIALGTNDTANLAVGSSVGLMTRIEQMMSVAHGEPVMWVNVKSLVASGPYSEADMRLWNDALLRACARYPNMRVFNWAAVVRPSWFISDGIHYTSAGYAARGRLIANALALAFPKAGSSAGCLVG